MSPRERILNGPPLRVLLTLALPNLAASLIQSAMAIVEGWYAGTLGPVALAGVALTFPLLTLVLMFSAGAIGGAVSGAMARAVGAQDIAGANAVLRVAVTTALVGGVLFGALVWGFGPWIFRQLGGSGTVHAAALSYANALFPLVVLIWLVNMLASALRGTGDMVRAARAIALVVALHATFVFGQYLAGAPFGLAGAAWAVVVAYGAGVVYLLWLFSRPDREIRLDLAHWPLLGGWRILGAGLLASSQSVMTVAYALLATAVFARFGDDWLAGYGMGARLELMVVPIIFGVGGAAMVVTGTLTGAGRRAEAVRVGWMAAALAAAGTGFIGLVLTLAPGLWIGFFNATPEIAEAASSYLTRVGPFYGFFGLGLCLYFASQGLQTLLYPVLGAAVRIIAVGLGFAALASSAALTQASALWVIAGAMALYGIFIAVALRLGPWSPRRLSADASAVG